ncbi:hypothetical protein P171DRAFT_432596 [Karstenula rhodostoma CBS 690.94]|uniref:Xylanolytic transcriptional activator regulatory domain-containing protein n=1 Tax=Karstenula rhodostoma CBS 690.94 TaxID=1392251 RepID=A0A9P4UAJ4_9PLEO|nr:hypothetical protein P171DRAFT_432596 [Karstenula rhodostoma CBS 690.94]
MRKSPGAVITCLDRTSNEGISNPVGDACADQSRFSLPFLLSYTDSRFESITYAFAASGAHVETVFNEEYDPLDGTFARPSEGNHTLWTDGAILQARVDEITQALASQHQLDTGAPSTNDQFPLDTARQVFTPHTLLCYVSAYFRYFHPHFAFIHRPTFDIHHASLPLLLAVALAGSAHSPPTDDALSAPCLYSVAEEYIFRCLHDMVDMRAEVNDVVIQTLQAAVLINALLYSSTDQAIARRGLFHRFPALVTSVRSLVLLESRRTMPLYDMSWGQFIAEESKIRTAAAVFFSGGISTITFNNAVQLPVTEMVGDLPCADALFEVPSPDEFTQLLMSTTCDTAQSLSLKEWVLLYLEDSWPGREVKMLTSTDPKLLTIHIIALHSIIYAARTSLLTFSSYTTLLRATDRWKELHNLVYARNNASETQLVGFVKYSVELWWLARKLLELAHAGKEGCRYLTGTPTDSRRDLREFVESYAQ